jgi:hypothetical protein
MWAVRCDGSAGQGRLVDAVGMPASACPLILASKIEPSTATETAIPIWRNVELTPEAMPASSGRTTQTAVAASGGVTRPAPAPAGRCGSRAAPR